MPVTPLLLRTPKGFTLIELIITIIIMSFAALIITPYLTSITHSPDPVLREQAIALGQAMMDEILTKRWDEYTPNGGGPICTVNESGPGRGNSSYTLTCIFPGPDPQATAPTSLGLDGNDHDGTPATNERQLWDDIDDYTFMQGVNAETDTFWDQDGNPINLPGFSRNVVIDYIASNATTIDATTPGAAGASTDTKRILVTVTSPLGETFQLVAVLCNF